MKKLLAIILTLCMTLTAFAALAEAPAEAAYEELAEGIYQVTGYGLVVLGSEKAAQFNPNPYNQAGAATAQTLADGKELVTLSTSAAADEVVDLGGVVLEPIAFSGAQSGTAYLDAERQILISGNLLGAGTADLSKQYVGSDVAGYINGYRAYLESLKALGEKVTDNVTIIANGVKLDAAYLADLTEVTQKFVDASSDIVLVHTERANSVGDFTATVGSASILVHMPFGGLYGYDLGGTTLCKEDSDYRFYITDYGKFNTIRDTDIQSPYILMNDEEALMIDCDMYNGPLFWETAFKLIGDRKFSVYITHQHGDHYTNLKDIDADRLEAIYWPKDEPAPTRWGYNPFDDERFADKFVYVDYDTEWNIAGRTLVIHKMTGHTPGGSVVIDKTDRILFTGDALGTQTFRGGTNTGSLTVEEYLAELNGLTELYGEDFDDIYQAHNLYSTPYVIDYLKTACEYVLENGTDSLIRGTVYLYNGQVLDATQYARIFGNEMFDSQNYYAIGLAIGQTAMAALQAQ